MADLYQALGGIDACRKLSAAFYARVAQDPVLRPIFPGSFHCAIEAFALFLAQFLGGPCAYSPQRWWLSLRESHLRFKIGAKERDAWMDNMRQAMHDVAIGEPAYSALYSFFEVSSAALINRGDAPATADIHEDLAAPWEEQRALDAMVASVRKGDAKHVIALAESPIVQTLFRHDRAALLSLLDLMSGSGHAAMLEYVRRRLLADPALARERYTRHRTLLHGASAAGSLTIVELLLRLGADPHATDEAGHTPLYCVGNECSVTGGGHMVRALVQAGADVNAHGGVKQCTPLHMAARRGNVEVAEALLDCGADLEARDSLGETPLRRAVNCGKAGVAALLVSRGADVHSRGSKGLTPLLAARTAAMKQVFTVR